MTAPLWPSLPLLDEACDRIFLQRFGQIPWIPATKMERFTPGNRVTDIVLVGRLHEEILDYKTWPGKTFRLWAMGKAGRDARLRINKMSPEHISFLDRYEMFPPQKSPRSFPKSGESWSLVFSGRIKEDKGFGYFLKVASAMQTQFGEKVKPVICGVLDVSKAPEVLSENKRLKSLLSDLPWTIRPEMWVGLPQSAWMEVANENPVLFNFSVFLNDDFGVSAAQAQAGGWPLLLSDWGGHKDVIGTNVRRFSVPREDVLRAESDVKALTELILTSMRKNLLPETPVKNFVPQVIGYDELESYARIMRDQGITSGKPWGPVIEKQTEEAFKGPGFF